MRNGKDRSLVGAWGGEAAALPAPGRLRLDIKVLATLLKILSGIARRCSKLDLPQASASLLQISSSR